MPHPPTRAELEMTSARFCLGCNEETILEYAGIIDDMMATYAGSCG